VVRRLQGLRKDAGLAVTQRVELGLATSSAKLRQAVAAHREHIAEELLAVRLQDGDLDGAAARQDLLICGQPLAAALRPAAPAAKTISGAGPARS